MPFSFNPVPVLDKEGLARIESAKEDVRALETEAYGEGCNRYDYVPPFYPTHMRTSDLELELHRIFPADELQKIAEEQKELRRMVDYSLAETVVTRILPKLATPETLFEYDLYVAGRDMGQIDSTVDRRRGRKDRQTHMVVLPLKEWADAWKERIFFDERADSEEVERYMPEDTNRLLSTVHRFYAVKSVSTGRKTKRIHNNGFLHGYEVDGNKLQVDWRTKSGAEFLWKLIAYLTGLEDKPGGVREKILDLAGVRLMLRDDFEGRSVELYQHFMDGYRGSCEGSLFLQVLEPNGKQMEDFLKKVPARLRNFISENIVEEDRSSVLSPEDVKKLERKYYLEMMIPFLGRNIINLLNYPLQTFKKIHEKQDDFIYKGRAEDWRNEHYTYSKWYLLGLLAPWLVSGHSRMYMEHIVNSKIDRIPNK